MTHVPTSSSTDHFNPHLLSMARGKALQNAVSYIDVHHGECIGGHSGHQHQIHTQSSFAPVKSVSPPPPHPTSDSNDYFTSGGVLNIPKLDCICNRSMKTVLCRSCGQMFNGRVRRTCLLHPNSIHLMDMVCCPNCKASQIKEFADLDGDRKRNI